MYVELILDIEHRLKYVQKKFKTKFKTKYGSSIATEVVNRPLSAFRCSKSVMTATYDEKGWRNFFRLRLASDVHYLTIKYDKGED